PFQLQPGAVALVFPRQEAVQTEYRSLVTASVAEQSVAAVAAVAQPAAEEASTPAVENLVDLAQAAADASDSDGFPLAVVEELQAVVEEADVDNQADPAGMPWLWLGLAGIVLAGGAGVWWRKRRAASTQAADGDDSQVQNDTSSTDSVEIGDVPEALAERTEAVASDDVHSLDAPVVAAVTAHANVNGNGMDEDWMDDMGMDGADPAPSRDDAADLTDFDVSEPDELVMPNIQADAVEAEP